MNGQGNGSDARAVSDGHEVYSAHVEYERRILDEVESGRTVSQRSLAQDLGIALGLTNLLMKRLVRKGWLRTVHIQRNRVRYLITPTGIIEKALMTRRYLEYSARFYATARNRILERFAVLAAEPWSDSAAGGKRIAFFGATEIAEIGYVCVHSTDLTLVGVVDETPRDVFFGIKVSPVTDLQGQTVGGTRFERLVVMSFTDSAAIRDRLGAAQVPPERLFWI